MSMDLARIRGLGYEHLSPVICMELAAGLSDEEGVRERYGLSEDEFRRLKAQPSFSAMYREAEAAFAGNVNAGNRITKKAELLLEEALPVIHRLMTSPEASTQTIIECVKQLTVLAGRNKVSGEKGAGAAGGFNVSIEINAGSEHGVVIQGN